MNIDKNITQRLESLFPGVILEPFTDNLHIRTDNWQITSEELYALKQMGLTLDSIYNEGGTITLVIDEKSTKKVIRK